MKSEFFLKRRSSDFFVAILTGGSIYGCFPGKTQLLRKIISHFVDKQVEQNGALTFFKQKPNNSQTGIW